MAWTQKTTTHEVWAVIKASHPDLVVFSSYSAPDGDMFGDLNTCKMQTEYGFDGALYPLIGALTTWEKGEKDYERVNVTTRYWVCIAIEEDNA